MMSVMSYVLRDGLVVRFEGELEVTFLVERRWDDAWREERATR